MGISSIGASPTPSILAQQAPAASAGRDSDGESAAQETTEGRSTKLAEAQNGGFAPNFAGLVNKLA